MTLTDPHQPHDACMIQVLRDEAGMGPDELQQLTFFLCHNYARCTRSVSMVPAVYYSHLAAKRAQIFSERSAFAVCVLCRV